MASALGAGRRGGLVAVAVTSLVLGADAITPCGRCRQVLNELAALDGTDPEVLCDGPGGIRALRLSTLLPHAFGPSSMPVAT